MSTTPCFGRAAALVCLIFTLATASATAQEVITLRSGNGTTGGLDGSITMLAPPSPPFSAGDFLAADAGPAANIVTPFSGWLTSIPADTAAQWISTSSAAGTGNSALYAYTFDVSSTVVCSATLDFSFAVDNALGNTTAEGLYLNGTPIAGTMLPPSGFSSQNQFLGLNVSPLLVPGSNTLYVYARDVTGAAGLIFSALFTINADFTSQTPGAELTPGLGFSCFNSSGSQEQSYIRVYDPAVDLGIFAPTKICALRFGVGINQSGDGVSGNCILIRLYSDAVNDGYPGDEMIPATIGKCAATNPPSLTLLAEDFAYLPDSTSGRIVHHEFTCGPVCWDPFAIGAFEELVVEIVFLDATATGGLLAIGVDQSITQPLGPGIGYAQSCPCGITTPTPTVSLGFESIVIDILHSQTGCTPCGPTMCHPGTAEDLILVSANRTQGTDMSDGHGADLSGIGTKTEVPATGGDLLEIRWGSPCGTFDNSEYIGLCTTLAASGPKKVPVAFGGVKGHDIYADLSSPAPFATTLCLGGNILGPAVLLPGCQMNRAATIAPVSITGSGLCFMIQIYALSLSANNTFAAATNGHLFGPF